MDDGRGYSIPGSHHESGRAYDSGLVGHLLLQDGNIASKQSARPGPYLFLERVQQVRAGIRHGTADDHDLRIEDVYKTGDSCRQFADGSGHNLPRNFVTLTSGLK